MPEASDMSLARVPLSLKRSQSFGSSTQAVRANSAGSWARIQSSLGAVKPGMARLPAMAARRGTRAASSSHWAALRPSFQRMAGRSTSPSASSATAPCIWPDRPMARTAASAPPWVSRSEAMALPTASTTSPR